MPVYVAFASPTMGGNFGKGQVHGMKQGLKTLTPGNLWTVRFDNGVPVDHATGQSSGKRQHKPITIRKEVDSASPLYLTALANNKVFPKLHLNFQKTNGQGTTELYCKITLTNAALVSLGRKPVPHNPSAGQPNTTNELEEIQFTFQKIEYTWKKGGISFSDSWDAPVK